MSIFRTALSRVLTVATVAAVLVPLAPQPAEAQVNPGVIGRQPRVAPPMMPTDTRTPAPATVDVAGDRVVR